MTSEEQADYDEPEMTFAELGVPGPLVHALADEGKRTAFPIQQDTLPDSLAGRDVLGRGRTGSGKTTVFRWRISARRCAKRSATASRLCATATRRRTRVG